MGATTISSSTGLSMQPIESRKSIIEGSREAMFRGESIIGRDPYGVGFSSHSTTKAMERGVNGATKAHATAMEVKDEGKERVRGAGSDGLGEEDASPKVGWGMIELDIKGGDFMDELEGRSRHRRSHGGKAEDRAIVEEAQEARDFIHNEKIVLWDGRGSRHSHSQGSSSEVGNHSADRKSVV